MVILPQLLRVTTVRLATTLKRLKLLQILEPSGREMGCGSDDFGPKMTRTGTLASVPARLELLRDALSAGQP
jgi:hypothetical protein